MTTSIPVNVEFISKWVSALRGGSYKQGRGRLRTGDTYCPLGVAYDILDSSKWVTMTESDRVEKNLPLCFSGAYKYMDNEFGRLVCLSVAARHFIGITHGVELEIISMSDAATPKTFSEIANYLEETLLNTKGNYSAH